MHAENRITKNGVFDGLCNWIKNTLLGIAKKGGFDGLHNDVKNDEILSSLGQQNCLFGIPKKEILMYYVMMSKMVKISFLWSSKIAFLGFPKRKF